MSLSIVLVIYFIVSLFCAVENYNFDVDFPIVYSDPFTFNGYKLNRSSYFGFSVILYEGAGSLLPWLQVGAPRGPNRFLKDETTGVVFRCGIKKKCNDVRLRTERERGISKFAFIGNTMDISEDKSKYAVCGHRWIEEDRKDYWMQGACMWANVRENNTQLLTPFYGLSYSLQVDRVSGRPAYNYAQGQAGFSAQFTKSKKDTELLLGAPGTYNWHGAPLMYKSDVDTGPIASRIFYSPRRHKRSSFDLEAVNIASGRTTTETLIFDLLGYSVTSGYFFSNNSISYVAGAPKAQMQGKILVFRFAEHSYEGLRVEDTKQGKQIGEYFGGALMAGDVNNDGFDDLMVGAPLHKTSKYDEGSVYIFLGSKSRTLLIPEKSVIEGKAPGGHFGQTIMYLGDIDNDGYGDVAIAAPYEDEYSGVVYVHRGTSNGLSVDAAQKIAGKHFEPTIKSFGISLSKPADIDGNRYQDIAIGAYLSGHTVLLRGKILVTIQQTISTTVDKVNYDSTYFEFTSCVRYTGYAVQGPIVLQRTIVIDETYRRAALQPGLPSEDIVGLTKIGEYSCKSFAVNVKNNITNRFNPITIDVNLDLKTTKNDPSTIRVGREVEGIDNFCTFCPMVNSLTSEMKKQKPVAFSLGCRDSSVCYSELILTSSFINLASNDYYTIGSLKYLTLQTTVRNKGENAHLTELYINLPRSVRLRSIPSSCSEQNATHIKCDVANTLKPNQQKTVTLELDMQEVNSGKYDGKLNFLLTVKTSSENNNTDFQELSLALLREADLALTGKSKEQSYSYGNISHGKTDFMQVYQVEKFGVSPIDQVTLHITIPTTVTTGGGDVNFVQVYPPIGSLSGQPLTCQSDIAYFVDNTKGISTDSIEGDNPYEENFTPVRRRRRRGASEKYQANPQVSGALDYPLNRTLYLNCTSPDVTCEKIVCTIGPFRTVHDVAELQLKMKIDVSNLADYLGERDIIIVSTNGALSMIQVVQNNGVTRPHEVSVASVFIGPTAEHSIPIWIIIVAVICGILLLLPIIAGLYKAGFFNRANKKKLEEEKMMKDEEETGMTSEHRMDEDKEE